ncbi:hypothetical protein N9B45_02300 [bacterium]|nr:hypothetical protein [bacterium]
MKIRICFKMLSLVAPKKEIDSKELSPRLNNFFYAIGSSDLSTECASESEMDESASVDLGLELAGAISLIPFNRNVVL